MERLELIETRSSSGLPGQLTRPQDSGRSAAMSATDGDDLAARLEALEAEERELSTVRKRLHDRLSSFPNELTIEKERRLSKRRRALHEQIDALRAERSKRRNADLRDD